MISSIIQFLETSPFMAGVMMLLLNIGSRYITDEYSDDDKQYQQNILLRRLAVFAACFVATRSITTSILLTAGFVILASGIFRKNKTYSREGMVSTPDMAFRAAAGLANNVDAPAYDKEAKEMFTNY